MKYKATINKELLLKLNQSLKGGLKANITLCKLLGVDYDNLQERSAVFKVKSIIIADAAYPKLRLLVKIKHNKQTFSIQWKYEDRVGHVRTGQQVREVYGAYPAMDVESAITLYATISLSFSNGVNWFEAVRDKASQTQTISQQFPKWLLHRKQEVKDGQLDEMTYSNDLGRWTNHISTIAMSNGKLFAQRSLRSIKRTDIVKLIENLKKAKCYDKKKKRFYSRGGSVINGIVANIKSFFEWCDDQGFVEENTNPVYRISKQATGTRDRVVPYSELGPFMDYLLNDYTKASERIRLAIYLTWFSGQRVGEVLQLKWDNVIVNEIKNQQVIFFKKKGRRSNDSKGKNIHPVFLPDNILKILKSIPRLDDNPYIFWTSRNRRSKKLYMSSGNLNDTINKVCVELGMERFTPHDIKKSIITNDDSKYGRAAVKMTTGNKSDRVIEDHYLWAIKNNEVEDGLYEAMKDHTEIRYEEMDSYMERPILPTNNKVVNLIPKQTHKRNGGPKLDRHKTFEETIKRKYGVSKSVYYRRKKDGYYDKKA